MEGGGYISTNELNNKMVLCLKENVPNKHPPLKQKKNVWFTKLSVYFIKLIDFLH